MTNKHRDADHCNKTQLHIDLAADRGIIHRDYIAHCLRWSFALRHIRSGSRVLDVGCGEAALLKTLYVNKFHPELYAAVDIRDLAGKLVKTNFPVEFRQLDITQVALPWPDASFDVVASFEVFEHFPPAAVDRVCAEIRRVLRPGGKFLVSTPNFNGEQATNHIHEFTLDELDAHLRQFFRIDAEYGTFASKRDILAVASPEEARVYEALGGYYDSNLLAILLAPLHPRESRNVLHVCVRDDAAADAQASAAREWLAAFETAEAARRAETAGASTAAPTLERQLNAESAAHDAEGERDAPEAA